MEYTLCKGKISAIISSVGAELQSFCCEGREYIWQRDRRFWSGQNTNLFPNIGAVRPEGYLYGGTAYPTPRHGFAKDAEFSLAEQGSDYLTLELRHSGESLALYPYPFVLRLRHSLTERGFRTEYSVENPGTEPMSFCIGGHPGFNIPGGESEDFGGHVLRFAEAEKLPAILPCAGGFIDPERTERCLDGRELSLRHSVFDRVDTLIFSGLRSGSLELLGPDGHGLRFDFADFPVLAVWSPPGKNAPFVCLEPWQGWGASDDGAEEFAQKPFAVSLQPGEKRSFGYEVSIV